MADLDKRQMAVALAYHSTDAAPKVVAKGHGLIAEAIIQRARESGVFVHESEDMVRLLMQVELDQQIPPQLYLAVAELLAWLYRLEHGKIPSDPGITDTPDQTQLKNLTLK